MKKSSFLFILFFSFHFLYGQDDYFWIGGSGNWSDFSHWATTSGGSTLHTDLPASADDIYFDGNSFNSSGQIVTLDVNANCQNMDWTGVTNFPTFNNSNNAELNIFGSLTLSPDATYDLVVVEFESNDAGETITSNGNTLGVGSNIRFNGSGEYTLQDNFSVAFLYHQNGTLNTNDVDIACNNRFGLTGASVRTLNLGSSTVTSERWDVNGSNITINAGTSTIITNAFFGDRMGDGPFTYHNLSLEEEAQVNNSGIFNEISIASGTEVTFESGATFTINSLQATGTKFNLVYFSTTTPGSEAFINKSSGTVNISYVVMSDIHATGGATFNASQSVDNGNNTGWDFTPLTGTDYYWIGNGGNWDDPSHWAISSGGATLHSDYPASFDNVFFDENSFSVTGQKVVINTDKAECRNMDWTGVTNMPEIEAAYLKNLYISGSASFSNGVIKDIYSLTFTSANSGQTIICGNQGKISYLSFDGTGEWSLQDSLFCSSVSLLQGTLDLNDQPVSTTFGFELNNYDAKELVMGNSNLYVGSWEIMDAASATLNAGTSTIHVSGDFDGKGLTYANAVFNGSSTVTGANTFENFTVTAGSDITLESGVTQTINGDMNLTGSKSNSITITATTEGNQATLSKNSGTVDAQYLILKDNNATGGATFNALQSIDNGNNTGWNITGITGLDYFWVGNSGNWSDFGSHWATTSGGLTFHTSEPGTLDNVFFDGNSFTNDNEVVTIDQDEVSFHDMDWSAIAHPAILAGANKSMNIFGSLILSPNQISTVTDYNFLSADSETINPSNGPGDNANFNFKASGEWSLLDSLTVREFNLENGTIHTNDHGVSVTFSFDIFTFNPKTLNIGTSRFFARTFRTFQGDNLTLNGANSTLIGSSYFDPGETNVNNSISLGDVEFIRYNATDIAMLTESFSCGKLSFQPGITVEITRDKVITTRELVVIGTASDPITIFSSEDGFAGTISQASGTVDGDFLVLKDNVATGGATFNADNSINNGNVSGWTFFKSDQTITFADIPDKTFGDPPFELDASASSGLEVEFTVISGPAMVSGSTLTIEGAGEISVRASQPGSIDFNPAPSVIKNFTVEKATQAITFADLEDMLAGETQEVSASTTSGLEVNITIQGPASFDGTTLTATGVGEITITASQPGNDDYAAAPDVVRVIHSLEEIITGLNKAENKLVIFPNPAKNFLAIRHPGFDYEKVIISTLEGKTVLDYEWNGDSQINISGVAPGIYLLRMSSGHASSVQKLIVEPD